MTPEEIAVSKSAWRAAGARPIGEAKKIATTYEQLDRALEEIGK